MALLIKGGEVVTADARLRADILVEGETIRAIGSGLAVPPGAEVIDAAGKLVFPGFIDPHVHIYLPCKGSFAADTHSTASRAALAGGTTTYIEMCGPNRHEDALEGYNTWKRRAEGASACDYAFHMTVSRWDEKTEAQLRQIVADGVTSFKIYLAYKGLFGLSDDEMVQVLRFARGMGVVTAAHCENADEISRLQQQFLAEGKTGPEWHEHSRPESVEAEGTARFAKHIEATGAEGYVVHVSCAPALGAALDAKRRGANIHIESVLPHLLLDKTCAERPGIEGFKNVMSPPLRDERNHAALWTALDEGLIDIIGTDHCPFTTAQKMEGRDDFTQIPNGVPGIEDRVNLIYTYGVQRGRLNLCRFVDVLSTRPAKIFGLYPRKGAIAVGSDADIVVYDPGYRGSITAARQYTNNDYNCYEGWPIEGRPTIVTVRGKVQVRDGVFVGEQGRGRLIRRTPRPA